MEIVPNSAFVASAKVRFINKLNNNNNNHSVERVKHNRGSQINFGPIEGYVSETVQDRK